MITIFRDYVADVLWFRLLFGLVELGFKYDAGWRLDRFYIWKVGYFRRFLGKFQGVGR